MPDPQLTHRAPGNGYGAVFQTMDSEIPQLNDHISIGDHRAQALASAARSINDYVDQSSSPHRSGPNSSAK